MMAIDPPLPSWPDAATLARPVARRLGAPPAVEGWTCQRLAGFGRGIGTWRPRGDADIAGARRSWSLVLKG